MNESDKISISGCVQLEAITINGYVYKWLPERVSYKYVKLVYPSQDIGAVATTSAHPVFFIHSGLPDSIFTGSIMDKGCDKVLQIPAVLDKCGKKETLTIDFLNAIELELK